MSGDMSNCTVYYTSAEGGHIKPYVLTTTSEDLFSRAIRQSGYGRPVVFDNNNEPVVTLFFINPDDSVALILDIDSGLERPIKEPIFLPPQLKV